MVIDLTFVRFWRGLDAALAALDAGPANAGEARNAWIWGLDARAVVRRRNGTPAP